MMAAAPRVETVDGDYEFLIALQLASIWKCHRGDPAIRTATLHFYHDPQQASRLTAGIHFFHHALYFIRRERGGNDEVFVGNDIPNVVYRRYPCSKFSVFIEDAMHDRIDHDALFSQCLCNRGADQLLDFTGVTAPAASVQRLRHLADRLCKRRFRLCKLRSCS